MEKIQNNKPKPSTRPSPPGDNKGKKPVRPPKGSGGGSNK